LPDDAETRSATRTAEARRPQPARTERHPGAGFVIVHCGAEALWVIVAWWELDILCHRLFRADIGTVDLRSLVTARAPSGCWLPRRQSGRQPMAVGTCPAGTHAALPDTPRSSIRAYHCGPLRRPPLARRTAARVRLAKTTRPRTVIDIGPMDRRPEHHAARSRGLQVSRLRRGADYQMHGDPTYLNAAEADGGGLRRCGQGPDRHPRRSG
jgi:hypothetical protein